MVNIGNRDIDYPGQSWWWSSDCTKYCYRNQDTTTDCAQNYVDIEQISDDSASEGQVYDTTNEGIEYGLYGNDSSDEQSLFMIIIITIKIHFPL